MDELTQEQVDKLRLLDNKLNESEWDFDLLAEDIPTLDFSDFDIDWGLPEEPEENTEIEEDEAPEPPAEPKAKLGDLWQLGSHRLICGDSTDVAVIDRLMDGVKADMVMTDPPYGINAEKMTMGSGAKEFYRGKDWDSERPDISIAFTLADNICIWGGNYFTDVLPISNDWLVWHKKNDGLSFSECELAWTNFGRNVRHISHHWGNEKKLHVTMKPVEVIAWAIQQVKEKAEVIVDLFGGSGSTLIACEQLNRKCYMAELDERYVSVIVQRWLNLTGRKDEIFCIRDGQKLTYDEVFN
jgi:site-specific DNA-methyltransferase (adenine-specific)